MNKNLNEWDCAAAIVKELESRNQVSFKILPETTNTITDLVVEDMNGGVYKIQGSEANDLFSTLLERKNIVYIIERENQKITFKLKTE